MRGHIEFMQRALAEAEKGRGRTRPNPMVGCVIVRRGAIVGVGYHRRAGAPHAEPAALKQAGARARGADAYVTLEPCSHVGRTGPCVQAVLEAGIRRVFVGTRDPNPIVNGRGIRLLRRAGVEVHVGLLGKTCRRLNEAYEHYVGSKTPFVVAKIAQSLDGKVATRKGDAKWITTPQARAVGHQLRNQLDAIMVGIGTVRSDNPRLTTRLARGRDPVRIVVDTMARTSPTAAVVQVAKRSKAPTWIAVGPEAPARRCALLERAGAQIIHCKSRAGRIDLRDLMRALGRQELLSVLVEGGPSLMGSLIEQRLVHKLHAFVAPLLIGGRDALGAVGGRGPARLPGAVRLRDVTVESVGGDHLFSAYLC